MTDNFHVIFNPLLPVSGLVVLACLAAPVMGMGLLRQARGAIGRSILFVLLLLALSNPSLVREKRDPLKDTALIVIDDSSSMKLRERAAEARHAAEAMANKLAAFADLDVETVYVSGETETDLFRALEQKRATIPSDRLAGIIAITDGEAHDAPSSGLKAPFHALIVGKKDEVDRRIVVKSAPAYGIIGQEATVTLRVEDMPKAQGSRAAVTIIRDDGTQENITMPVGEDVEIKTEIKHAGANVLAFEAETVPNELTPINNVATVTVNGIRDRLRVLLVSGEPHIGGRNWRNLLKADPDVDLIHFTILRSPFKDNAVPNKELSLIAFPTKEIFDTKLNQFNMVIFDGFTARSLVPDNYLENIAKYVEDGGALLITNAIGEQAAQLSSSPLAKVLPTVPSGKLLTGSFVPAVTDEGKRHPVTATLESDRTHDLWSPWYRQVEARLNDRASEVLLSGINQKPLLVLGRVGKGRVAQFMSNQFWLWTRDYPHGGPQAELLRRTTHWLVQEPELDETALHAKAESADDGWKISITKRSLKDNSAAIVLTGPDNQPQNVKLSLNSAEGILTATVPVKTSGLYHVKDDKSEIFVMTGSPNAPEFGAMTASGDVLAPIAKASAGSVTWLADQADGPDVRRTDKNGAQSGWGWIGLKKNGQYRIVGSNAYPLWPAWAALVVLLLAAMAVWRREGR